MKRQKRILLLVETSLAHGRGIIRGISHFMREQRDWDIFFEDRGLHEQHPSLLRSWDGIISRTPTRKLYQEIIDSNITFVELLYGDELCRATEVLEDMAAICEMAAEHFIERGLESFAFFVPVETWWSNQMVISFSLALKKNGKAAPNIYMVPKSDSTSHPSPLQIRDQKCEIGLAKWLRHLRKPVGILTPMDMYAVSIYEAVHRIGLAIPEEIAVLGVDNDRLFCQTLNPPLSSIDTNSKQIGYYAAALLEKKMKNMTIPTLPIFIPPAGIVVRQSTDVIATQDVEVVNAIRFIRENITKRISISDIVMELNISRSSLERKFRASLGHSPNAEIVRYRMERVKEMIRETDVSIEKVAKTFGYTESEYFIRAFKRLFHITPHQYRLMQKHPLGLSTE